MFRFLVLLATLLLTEAYTPASCCVPSRLPISKVAARAAIPCLCDAPAEEAAVAPEAAAPEEVAAAAPKAASGSKTPLDQLEVGQEVEGKIRSVMAYGAFVDIGAATDALLHVSEISNEFIQDATEKLTAGETVKGKIKAINMEKGQLALTCKEPRERRPPRPKVDLTKYESADEKEFVAGKVNSITDFGAFVTLEDGVDGLVHISQVQEGGVGKVSDVLTIGQEVQVRVQSVDKAKRRIGLSMLPWSENEKKKGGGGRGGGGFGGDIGFGEADAEFKMNEEELESLAVGEFTSSPFDFAFERAAEVKKVKDAKGKYGAVVL